MQQYLFVKDWGENGKQSKAMSSNKLTMRALQLLTEDGFAKWDDLFASQREAIQFAQEQLGAHPRDCKHCNSFKPVRLYRGSVKGGGRRQGDRGFYGYLCDNCCLLPEYVVEVESRTDENRRQDDARKVLLPLPPTLEKAVQAHSKETGLCLTDTIRQVLAERLDIPVTWPVRKAKGSGAKKKVLGSHFVWSVRGRQPVLVDDVLDTALEVITEQCDRYGFKLKDIIVNPDYVHLILSSVPEGSMAELARGVKGQTSKIILGRHPELQASVGSRLWNPSFYFVGRVADLSPREIKDVVDAQNIVDED